MSVRFRWTMTELAEWSDLAIIAGILNERKDNLNPHAPLATRINKIRSKIEKGEPLTTDDNAVRMSQ